MPSYIISLKDGAPESEYEKVKEQVKKDGGKITNEFSLIKGFSVEFDDDKVSTLSENEHLNVEKDQEVRIS